jgi:hypothetical protein
MKSVGHRGAGQILKYFHIGPGRFGGDTHRKNLKMTVHFDPYHIPARGTRNPHSREFPLDFRHFRLNIPEIFQ